ncbi:MAG: hypothetical protein HS111_12965 [Kofleriaceae bacterium]|nr:hypothetical protein [Kofleriaceae bacterium]
MSLHLCFRCASASRPRLVAMRSRYREIGAHQESLTSSPKKRKAVVTRLQALDHRALRAGGDVVRRQPPPARPDLPWRSPGSTDRPRPRRPRLPRHCARSRECSAAIELAPRSGRDVVDDHDRHTSAALHDAPHRPSLAGSIDRMEPADDPIQSRLGYVAIKVADRRRRGRRVARPRHAHASLALPAAALAQRSAVVSPDRPPSRLPRARRACAAARRLGRGGARSRSPRQLSAQVHADLQRLRARGFSPELLELALPNCCRALTSSPFAKNPMARRFGMSRSVRIARRPLRRSAPASASVAPGGGQP